jgi:hypothetical protein
MPTEADTCRKLAVRRPLGAGGDNEPYSIAEHRWVSRLLWQEVHVHA